MRVNADLTLYNKYVDSATRMEKWQRTQIPDVFWENRKAANVIKSGMLEADQASIYILFQRGANYLSPTEWQTLVTKTGKWTLQIGDVVVKGLITDEITTIFTMTDLKAKHNDVLSITSIDFMDSGSPAMQHWQVGAK